MGDTKGKYTYEDWLKGEIEEEGEWGWDRGIGENEKASPPEYAERLVPIGSFAQLNPGLFEEGELEKIRKAQEDAFFKLVEIYTKFQKLRIEEDKSKARNKDVFIEHQLKELSSSLYETFEKESKDLNEIQIRSKYDEVYGMIKGYHFEKAKEYHKRAFEIKSKKDLTELWYCEVKEEILKPLGSSLHSRNNYENPPFFEDYVIAQSLIELLGYLTEKRDSKGVKRKNEEKLRENPMKCNLPFERIDALFEHLKGIGAIHPDTNQDNFRRVFSGEDFRERITWTLTRGKGKRPNRKPLRDILELAHNKDTDGTKRYKEWAKQCFQYPDGTEITLPNRDKSNDYDRVLVETITGESLAK